MEGIVDTDPVPMVKFEESEIPSAATTGLEPAELKGTNDSGRGDGSAASCPWSLTHEQHVQNLKENWVKAFPWKGARIYYRFGFDTNPWFANAVSRFRDDPSLDGCYELEMDESVIGLVSGWRMTSLDLAILMGDLKMVQKILEKDSIPDNVIHGSLVDFEKASSRFLLNISIDCKQTGFLYTPLHLAVAGGNRDIVDALLEKGASVNVQNWMTETPLDIACKIESVDMLLKLLEKDDTRKDPLHVAVQYGDVNFIKELPTLNVNARDKFGRTPLHYLATKIFMRYDVKDVVQYLAQDKTLDVKALDAWEFSAFYVAIICCNTQLVIALLESFKDQIRLNEVCDLNCGPPIQIAFKGGLYFKDINIALMEYDSVKSYMETLYRDRQVYVDAANALLVGAALIASVTFASWLQPPLNYTSYFGEGYSSSTLAPSISNLNYVDLEHNIALRAFWIFNALSFYFAIACVVCGARSVLPRSHLFIKKIVEKLRTNLLVTSILLACSVLFVIIAFAIAGTIVLTPILKYQWYMIVPTLVGGVVCIVSLVFLVKNMREIYSNSERTYNVVSDDLKRRGYRIPPMDYDREA